MYDTYVYVRVRINETRILGPETEQAKGSKRKKTEEAVKKKGEKGRN